MELVGLEPRIGLDRVGVDAGRLGDALGQGGELHRLEEGDELPRVELGRPASRRAASSTATSASSVTSCFEMRACSAIAGERLAPLRLLDLVGAGEQRLEVAVLVDELRRGLDADAGHAGHVVGGVADQRLDVDDLLRRHAEIVDHALAVDLALGPVAGLALRARFEIVELHLVARRAASGPCRRR